MSRHRAGSRLGGAGSTRLTVPGSVGKPSALRPAPGRSAAGASACPALGTAPASPQRHVPRLDEGGSPRRGPARIRAVHLPLALDVGGWQVSGTSRSRQFRSSSTARSAAPPTAAILLTPRCARSLNADCSKLTPRGPGPRQLPPPHRTLTHHPLPPRPRSAGHRRRTGDHPCPLYARPRQHQQHAFRTDSRSWRRIEASGRLLPLPHGQAEGEPQRERDHRGGRSQRDHAAYLRPAQPRAGVPAAWIG